MTFSRTGSIGLAVLALMAISSWAQPGPNAPVDVKFFGAGTIGVGGTTTLDLTVNNPSAADYNALTFTDTLPPGLVIATPNGLLSACTPGSTLGAITAVAGSSTISVAASHIAAATAGGSGACTVQVDVVGVTPGVKPNSFFATDPSVGAGNTSTASITVLPIGPPTIAKAFGAPTIPVGGTTSLVITITAPNALANVSFTDTLPAGLAFAVPSALAQTCGGVAVAATGPPAVLSLSGGVFAAAGTCTVSANVTGISTGVQVNSVQVSDVNAGAGNTATASITVLAPATLTKAFGAPQIVLLGVTPTNTTSLTFTIANPNAVALTGLAFTDTLPSGLVIATPNVVTSSCGGVLTATAGSQLVTLTGGALAGNASCVISLNVSANGVGLQVNTTSTISSTGGVGPAATATILVVFGAPTSSYQINYLPAAGTGIAGGYIDISNDGSLGADAFGPLAGTTGRICVNVYTFTADEQESECCSCLVTPNALVHLTAADLIGNPGNGVTPTLGLVVKLLATIPGPGVNTQGTFTSSACNAAQTFTAANLAPGLVAWATKFHGNPTASPATSLSLTETRFSRQALTQGELTKLTNLCQFLSGNQSGAGLCKACSLGGLGAGKR